MTVRSDPPGALVMVDGQEMGYTPCSFDFLYYGTREITLMMPGYETLTTLQKVQAPWYQYPGIDFFADNFSPAKITNRHEFFYTMQPQAIVPTDELLDREIEPVRIEGKSGAACVSCGFEDFRF